MKKKLFGYLLFFVAMFSLVACKGNDRTYEKLMDKYVKAYLESDIELVKDIFPPFYIEYSKEFMTKEHLEANLKYDKALYGDDFNITYEVTGNEKLTDEELETLNNYYKTILNVNDKAEECYTYSGTITYKGKERSIEESIDSFMYCKYSGKWYLVIKK